MANEKHTPGPWLYAPEWDGDGEVVGIDHFVIADEVELACPARKADALLIAAAPDLLALAHAYEAWEADLILNGDWSGSCVRMTQTQHDRMLELQAMRNAAVAKATGK